MKIYVCIKHVPNTAAKITLDGSTSYDESVKFVVNPYDEFALEEALKIAGADGEVVLVCVGKEAAVSTMRSALAMGAHRGILVKVSDQFVASGVAAQAIVKAIQQDGEPDLVLCGKQSVDSEGMQTHYRIAKGLDLPVISEVAALTINDGAAVVERELEGGSREVISVSLPCVIGATKGLNEPRYPKLPDILKAKKKEIKQIELSELDIDTAGKTTVTNLESSPERGAAKMITGEPRAMAEELVDLLINEAKVL
ncbi:MAG: electron transfer flavoprotein subunit beta/FixA family protein [Bacteroidetes bacterium]|nr:electron transfer flavoprotein subunit beta/FixA family protein [Bacteroidota bacterium]